MKTHKIKIWPEYFNAVLRGVKTFEVRVNDRDYKERDLVTLREWNPSIEAYTGLTKTYLIGYVYKIPGSNLAVFSLLEHKDV